MDRTFLAARIESTKATIAAYEDALDAFATNGAIQTYTIDTGQSRQTVSRSELTTLNKTVDALYNRCATLEARLTGGTLQARPRW